MARITKKQVESANAKLKNGFELDVWYYLTHGEKTAIKRVKIGENTFAELRLMYRDEWGKKDGWNQPTGRQIPTCHVSKEIAEDDGKYMHSYGLGQWVTIGEPQSKKMFSTLQKLSGEIDIEPLVDLARDEPNTLEESKPLFG